MNAMAKVLLIFLAIMFLGLGFVGCTIYGGYNTAVSLDEEVKAAWAQVENQLQRRFDLIPNLVSTVKGFASQEEKIFLGVADARKAYTQAQSVGDKAQASLGLSSALSRLLMIQERYPELKSNQGFLKLHDDLSGTESRIGVARMRYNDSVKELNTYTRKLIGRFVSGLAGVGPAEFFKVEEAAKVVPKVDFSGKP